MSLRRIVIASALSVSALVGTLSVGSAAVQAADDPAAKASITLKFSDSKLGRIVTDGAGLSLYMFTRDSYKVSNCEGQCLIAWPPLKLAKGESLANVKLGDGMRRSKLGVFVREDGSQHVTYEGWPLYYWFNDKVAGDLLGQWVGNVWFVITENGDTSSKRV
jgi:predicted lipoprotein with Yx(FWY)xxD motif